VEPISRRHAREPGPDSTHMADDANRLTLDELSRRSGAPAESLRQWRSLGLVGCEGDETFGREDVQRVRFIRLLLRRGVSIDALVHAEGTEGFIGRHVGGLFPSPIGPTYSPAETASRLGLDAGALTRFVKAAGIDEPDGLVSEDDVRALEGLKVLLESGFPEDALLQLVRVYEEALGRVAEAEVRLFHFYVHERLRAEGLSGHDLIAVTEAARERMLPLAEPSILYFHRRGFARAVQDDAMLHLQQDTALLLPGQLRLAVAFVDLSSFTPLAEVMGDHAAAEVLARFSQLVHDAAARGDGRVVKQIGDAFMVVFQDARSAVACALAIKERALAEPQFPAVRAGVQCGHVLYREGDYLGANVNVAARLADIATRHQVLVTAAVKEEAKLLADVEFVPLGRRPLKGMAEQPDLFEVRSRASAEEREEPPRLVDPVCGIEMRPERAVARLLFEGEERLFCCHVCLQRFVEAPERYRA
jgi:adenylate cyclase